MSVKELKWLIEQIEDELDDAEKYAKAAAKFKSDNKSVADTCIELSRQEIKHSEMLHMCAVEMIEKYKASGKSIPEGMKTVYDFMHERMIERAAKVKMMLSQYSIA
nr:MAG TPA: Ferritin [Caudoviricetes sp.]